MDPPGEHIKTRQSDTARGKSARRSRRRRWLKAKRWLASIKGWSWITGGLSVSVLSFVALTVAALYDETKQVELSTLPKFLVEAGVDETLISQQIDSATKRMMDAAQRDYKRPDHAGAMRADTGVIPIGADAKVDISAAVLSGMTVYSGAVAASAYERHKVDLEPKSALSPEGLAEFIKRYFHFAGGGHTAINVSLTGSAAGLSMGIRVESGFGPDRKIFEAPPLYVATDGSIADVVKKIRELCGAAATFVLRSTDPIHYAMYMASQGKIGPARLLLSSTALRDKNSFALANMRLGELDLQEGRWGDAEVHYGTAIGAGLKWGWLNIGLLRSKEGRLLEAIAITSQHLPQSRGAADRALALSNIGSFYQDLGQLEKAETFYKKALEYDAQHPLAISNLCHLYLQRRSLDAQPYCAASYEDGPTDEQVTLRMAESLSLTDLSGALRYVEPLIQSDPDEILIGWASWIAGIYGQEMGQRILDTHISSFFGRDGAYEYALASIQYQTGDFSEAAANYASAAHLGWRPYDAMIKGASAYWRLEGQAAAAATLYQEAAAVAPSEKERAWVLATSMPNGKTERMLGFYAAAAQAGEHSATFYDNWGHTYENLNRLTEASELYRLAIGERPSVPSYWVDLGDVLLSMTGPTTAWTAYQRALELQPRYLRAINGLARADIAQGRHRQAVTRLTAALANSTAHSATSEMRNPYDSAVDSADLYGTLGRAYLIENRDRQAVEALKKCLNYFPAHEPCQNNLGVALNRQGEFADAADAWVKALKIPAQDPKRDSNMMAVALNPDRYGTRWCRLLTKDAWPDEDNKPELTLVIAQACGQDHGVAANR